jgi:hypothetical protein
MSEKILQQDLRHVKASYEVAALVGSKAESQRDLRARCRLRSDFEKYPAKIQAPTDIALCGLNTHNIFRKRFGLPRSETSRSLESNAPLAATKRASRARFLAPGPMCNRIDNRR